MRQIETWLLTELLEKCGDESVVTLRDHAAGEIIFREGDVSDYMAILLSGIVELRHRGRVCGRGVAGSVFGEMGLIDRAPRSAEALALTHCRVAEINDHQFRRTLESNPGFALSIMRQLTDRLRPAA